MQENMDRSTESLLARRALAEKATPGPWKEHVPPQDDFDDDSTFITTEARQDASKVEIAKLELTLPYDDDPTDFNIEQRANVAHIAANSPDVVMADIDELIRLRAEVPRLEHEAQWLADLAAATYCTNEDRDCEKVRGKPLFEVRAACMNCWRQAAREAGEESCR